ncbi:MAG: DinB family protein [Armatimonadetes bacterium]|nr:DinB family protein [Armatimonadota bacterium]
MTENEFTDEYSKKLQALTERAKKAVGNLTEAQLNHKMPEWYWTVGQITGHMIKSHDTYLQALEPKVSDLSAGGSGTIKRSLFGKLVAWGVGPSGKVSAPRVVYPDPTPATKELAQRFIQQTTRIAELCDHLKGKNLDVRVPNPFNNGLKQTLPDSIVILERHLERHIGQIEWLTGLPSFPK